MLFVSWVDYRHIPSVHTVRLALLQNSIFIPQHKGCHVTLVSFELCSLKFTVRLKAAFYRNVPHYAPTDGSLQNC